ncbi:hypothetical protein BsWGS_10476 [Bradybaena similaris]
MDDCNLANLTAKQGVLSPAFHKDVTDYSVTVPSSAEKITFDLQTSDNGASFSITNSGGSRDVPLKEGATTDIKIEVTSEDGHVKSYIVHARRLSAKDAVLTKLTVKNGTLEPEFSPNQEMYFCLLPSNIVAAAVTAVAPDPKNTIVINGNPPASPIPLNLGLTVANIEVTSADQSNKKIYKLDMVKKQIPRYVKFTNPKSVIEYECPISLNPLYCPITIKHSNPKCTYTGPSITELTRTSKVDPLTGQALLPGWEVCDFELEKKMAAEMVVIPLTYSGTTKPRKFSELAEHLAECNIPTKSEDLSGAFPAPTSGLNRQLQEHKWQKALEQIFDENNPANLLLASDNFLKEYYSKIPKPGQYHRQYNFGESPLDYLQHAIHCLATAVKFKPKDANLHFRLAMALEEIYHAEDMYGLKKEEKAEAPSLNLQAKESSKEEEVFAICRLKGVDPSAPVSHHLQALDAEYHHLLDTQQSAKADHVQNLYAWYSKKVSQEGAAAHKAEDNQSPLGQAYQKYLDALCLEESNADYNFHVGRLLVIMGNYDDAIKRLEAALSRNSNHEMARLYLGLSISLSKQEWKKRSKEAIKFLLAGMETLLCELSKEANMAEELVTKTSLFAENLVRATNVHLLRSVIQLGNLLMQNSDVKDAMAPADVFHTAALLASQVLPKICRGDLYKQVEWVLVDAHTQLLELLTQKQTGNEDLIALRCQRLSALIFNSTISGNAKLLELQEKTCQKLAKIQPCVSYVLFLLGSAQLALCENSTAGEKVKQKLLDAKALFEASIELEGKSTKGSPPEAICKQKWWSQLAKAGNDDKKTTAKAEDTKGPALPSEPASTATAKNGGRGASTVAAARGRGVAVKGKPEESSSSNTQAKGGPTAQGGAAATRGGLAARGGARGGKTATAPAVATAPAQAPASQPSSGSTDTIIEPETQASLKVAQVNATSYQPRLGLARVLRALNEPNEAKKYYFQVMDMAPEVHDAYIESAEMLSKSDPLEAVNVYCRFPISENPTYDDAYIFGEIVRILMKNEKFDDERLAKNMIAYGKVLGLVVLDNYTKILEQKRKNDLLKKVYAGVNNKSVDDPDMQAFFKFKFWL